MREYHSARDRTTTVYGHGNSVDNAGRQSGRMCIVLAEPATSVVA